VLGLLERKGDIWATFLTAALVKPLNQYPSNSQLWTLGMMNICFLAQCVHKQLGCTDAVQGPNKPAAAKDSSAHSQPIALLQLLVSTMSNLAEDTMRAKLAAALLPCVQGALTSSKPAMRKLVIDVASMTSGGGNMVAPAQPTAHAVEARIFAAGAASIMLIAAATKDKDATVRAKALTSLQGMLPVLRQQQLGQHGPPQLHNGQQENQACHRSVPDFGAFSKSVGSSSASKSIDPAATVSASLVPCILDKSKTVRLKAMKLIAAVLTCKQQTDPSAQQSSSPTTAWQEQVAELANRSFSNLCKLLEVRPDTALYCPDSQEAATELLQVLPLFLAPKDILSLAIEKGQSPSAAQLLLQHLQSRCTVQELYVLWVAHLAAPVTSATLEHFRSLLAGKAAGQCLQQRCFQALCQALSLGDAPGSIQAGHLQALPASAGPGSHLPEVPAPSPSFLSIVQLLYISGGISSSILDAQGEVAILLDVLAITLAAAEHQQEQEHQGAIAQQHPVDISGAVPQPCKQQQSHWATVHTVMLLLRGGSKAHEQQLAGVLYRSLHALLPQLQDAPTPVMSLAIEVGHVPLPVRWVRFCDP
jgi:hypothetical protein